MTQVLETCIGLALMFLLCSLLVSALVEFISASMDRRAKLLKTALTKLVGDAANAAKILDHDLLKGMTQEKKLPSYVEPRLFATALLDLQTVPPAGAPAPGAAVVAKLNAMPVVRAAPTPAAQQVALQQEIELWFQEAMNRWEGSYKRLSQTISLIICILLVPALNINTVTVAQALWTSPALRQQMTERAQDVLKDTVQNEENATPPANGEGAVDNAVQQRRAEIDALGLPIGWNEARPFRWDTFFNWSSLPGWLISILAISAGSAFWFDALNRLVNLRLTGAPPKEVAPEKVA